jgi:hypothetical protein
MRLIDGDNTILNGCQSANDLITTKDLDSDDVGDFLWSFNKHVYSPNDLYVKPNGLLEPATSSVR